MNGERYFWWVVDGQGVWHLHHTADADMRGYIAWSTRVCDDASKSLDASDHNKARKERPEGGVCVVCAARCDAVGESAAPKDGGVVWARTRDAWHRHTPDDASLHGMTWTRRECDGRGVWADLSNPYGTSRTRPGNGTVCDACSVSDTRGLRKRCLANIAAAFDVPEDVTTGAADDSPWERPRRRAEGIAGWAWGKAFAGAGVWHLWTEDVNDASTVYMACDVVDEGAGLARDSLARRSETYDEGRANCSTCRALWPWAHMFERRVAEATRERGEAVQASLLRIRERDEATRERDAIKERTTARPTTRYGRVDTVPDAPGAFVPVCALCPDGGRHLMPRVFRGNARDALTAHVARNHTESVPVGSDGAYAECSIEECDVAYTRRHTPDVRRAVVAHEIECHPQGDV